MTHRKASVQRRKLEDYIRKGTCAECHCSIVWTPSGLCRKCKPVVEERTAERREAIEATWFFHYWLTCRKKATNDIGVLARTILGTPWLRQLVGLEEIASKTTKEIDVKVLEDAWAQSEAQRREEMQEAG